MSRPPPDPATRIGRVIVGLYKIWPVVLAIISTAWATYGWMQMRFEERIVGICQPVVQDAVKVAEEQSDKKLRANFEHQQRLELRLKQSQDDVQRMYWYYVGDQAAARERRAQKRQLATAKARIAFDEQIKKGKTPQEALSNVLARPP